MPLSSVIAKMSPPCTHYQKPSQLLPKLVAAPIDSPSPRLRTEPFLLLSGCPSPLHPWQQRRWGWVPSMADRELTVAGGPNTS